MTRQEIGQAIKSERIAQSKTQPFLSQAINSKNVGDISNIEAGKVNITIDKLITICNALNLTITITKA